jgi:hypothetical protein
MAERVSDQLNEAFARPLVAFRNKLEVAEDIGHEVVIPRVLQRLPVPQFRGEPRQELLDEFPNIYDHDTTGREFFKISEGMGDDGFEYNLAAPICEYGEDFPIGLISAAYTLRDAALNPQSPANIIDETADLIEERRTIYQSAASDGKSPITSSFTPFTQGIQSVLFTAGIFTAKKVECFDDPIELMDELTKQKMFSKFGLIVPSTITARMGDRGWVFTPPPVDQEAGKFALSQILIDHYTGPDRERYKDLSSAASKLLDRRGCPAARTLPEYDASSVDMTAQLVTDTMKMQRERSIKFAKEIGR